MCAETPEKLQTRVSRPKAESYASRVRNNFYPLWSIADADESSLLNDLFSIAWRRMMR
jgi:hypothetical protein